MPDFDDNPETGAGGFAARVLPHRKTDSILHGPEHWRRVADYGRDLAERMNLPATDVHNVHIFAWTHDLARVSDRSDPEHGVRGAHLFLDIAAHTFPEASALDRTRIAAAIEHHNTGMTADTAVRTGHIDIPETDDNALIDFIGCCWDADRLDLLRLGRFPHPERMSTHCWEAVLPNARIEHGYR